MKHQPVGASEEIIRHHLQQHAKVTGPKEHAEIVWCCPPRSGWIVCADCRCVLFGHLDRNGGCSHVRTWLNSWGIRP